MKNFKRSFYGKKVKQRLIELEMTQRELAEKTGIKENYITQILTGRKAGWKHREKINEVIWREEEMEKAI